MASRVLVAVAALGVLAGCAGSDEVGLDVGEPVRAPPAPAGRPVLAVARTVTGNPPQRDVLLYSASGRPLRRVAPDAAGFSGPAWSPDGRRLAYVAAGGRWTDANPPTDLFTVDVASERTARLTTVGDAFAPVWSPDGRTLVFSRRRRVADRPAEAGLWAVDADGGPPHALSPPPDGRIDTASGFSPDGAALAVTRSWVTEDASAHQELRVVATDSLETGMVIERARDGTFSPDGRSLAYASDRDENGYHSYGDISRFAAELYVRNLESGDDTRLTRTKGLDEATPAWSPDGRLLAYQRGRTTGNASGTVVMTMRSDGDCPRRVTFDLELWTWYSHPRWRPGQQAGADHLRCAPSPRKPALAPPAGNLSLDAARRFRPFRVLWLGRRFGDQALGALWRDTVRTERGRGPVVHLRYGRLDVELWHACARVPGDLGGPSEDRTRARGVAVGYYQRGGRMELVTGRTTVVVYGSPARFPDVLRMLRPVGAARPTPRLPPPAPGALEGGLRCP